MNLMPSKYNDEERIMHLNRDNIECFIHGNTVEVTKEIFNPLVGRYSDFIFD